MVMEDMISNSFTNTSNFKDMNKIDASSDSELLDACKNYLSENNLSSQSDFDDELKKCNTILDLESESQVELKSCLNPSDCNVEGFIPQTDLNNNSNILEDPKNDFSEDTLCSKSDLDSEIKKCCEILELDSQTGAKNCSNLSEYSGEGFVPKTDVSSNSRFVNCSKNNFDKSNFHLKSALDIEFEECYKILNLKSCECNGEDLIPKTNILNSRSDLIPNSPSVVNNIDNCAVILNNQIVISAENLDDLLPPEIKSEVLPKDANDNCDAENMNEFLTSDHKNLINETRCSSEESKFGASLNDNRTSNKAVTDNQEILKKDDLKDDKKIKDYLEDEKDDLINPGWEAIKKLTTDEQRYQQVRKCWGSRKIPDPNKDLTYHSYRKRLFSSRYSESRTVTSHKRQASTQLNGKSAKRQCTFFLDKEINTIERKKKMKKQAILDEMHGRISSIDYQGLRRGNTSLHHQFNTRVSVIQNEYLKIVDTCEDNFSDKIYSLNEQRNEVLQFYGFYKGLNVSNEDPTQLTESQFQDLNEIEDVYKQFNFYY